MWLIVPILGLFMFTCKEAAGPEWHLMQQSGYDMKFERAYAMSFNRSYFSDFKVDFVPYNRTIRTINLTTHLLVDLTKDLRVNVQVFKFRSNEYRYFPIDVTFNLCTECKLNSFGCKYALLKNSNFKSCPLKKGFYYITNGLPDFSKLPPYIPIGRYQVEWNIFHEANFLVKTEAFLEIVEKSSKWTK